MARDWYQVPGWRRFLCKVFRRRPRAFTRPRIGVIRLLSLKSSRSGNNPTLVNLESSLPHFAHNSTLLTAPSSLPHQLLHCIPSTPVLPDRSHYLRLLVVAIYPAHFSCLLSTQVSFFRRRPSQPNQQPWKVSSEILFTSPTRSIRYVGRCL